MDLLPYALSAIEQIPGPIPPEHIFVSKGIISLISKAELISIIHSLELSTILFEDAGELEMAIIHEMETETIWLVRLLINHQISHGLVLGSEL